MNDNNNTQGQAIKAVALCDMEGLARALKEEKARKDETLAKKDAEEREETETLGCALNLYTDEYNFWRIQHKQYWGAINENF